MPGVLCRVTSLYVSKNLQDALARSSSCLFVLRCLDCPLSTRSAPQRSSSQQTNERGMSECMEERMARRSSRASRCTLDRSIGRHRRDTADLTATLIETRDPQASQRARTYVATSTTLSKHASLIARRQGKCVGCRHLRAIVMARLSWRGGGGAQVNLRARARARARARD